MVIKNLENKIKLVGIICVSVITGCVVISLSSIWTARGMVADAQQKIYVLGRQCADTGAAHLDGRDARCGGQVTCRSLSSLLLYAGAG